MSCHEASASSVNYRCISLCEYIRWLEPFCDDQCAELRLRRGVSTHLPQLRNALLPPPHRVCRLSCLGGAERPVGCLLLGVRLLRLRLSRQGASTRSAGSESTAYAEGCARSVGPRSFGCTSGATRACYALVTCMPRACCTCAARRLSFLSARVISLSSSSTSPSSSTCATMAISTSLGV